MFKMSHYTQHIPPGALDGRAEYPWYAGDEWINSATPKVPLGTLWELTGDHRVGGGNIFMSVRAEDALVQGKIVGNPKPLTYTCTATGTSLNDKYNSSVTDAPTKWSSVLTSYPGSNVGAPAQVGDIIYISSGGGAAWYCRTIKEIVTDGTYYRVYWAQPDFTIPRTVDPVDLITTAPTGGSDTVVIIRPYTALVSDVAVGTPQTPGTLALPGPIGVALTGVTAGNYTIIQVAGTGLVHGIGNGSGTDIKAGSLAGSDAGSMIGLTTSPHPTTFWIKSHVAYNGAGLLLPATFDFRHGL